MAGIDPVSLAMGAVQTGVGLYQTVSGMIKAGKAEKKLQGMVDGYQSDPTINDYYTKAFNRYNVNPFNSATYTNQKQNAERATATGLTALQDRRSGVAGISGLIRNQNDAMLNATAAAERQQGANLSQLGQATGMKAEEDRRKFDMQYNLLSMKAGGANAVGNAGLNNAFKGLGSMSEMYALGGGNGGGGGTGSEGGGGGGLNYADYIKFKKRGF